VPTAINPTKLESLRRQAPQRLVNWFHPQWVGPSRWGTQDEVRRFNLIGFMESLY
jgi:hypothetical protein